MEFLSYHHEAAYAPRVDTLSYKKNLARAALKHVPGSEALIQKTFDARNTVIPHEIQPEEAKPLVMHTGFIQH